MLIKRADLLRCVIHCRPTFVPRDRANLDGRQDVHAFGGKRVDVVVRQVKTAKSTERAEVGRQLGDEVVRQVEVLEQRQ